MMTRSDIAAMTGADIAREVAHYRDAEVARHERDLREMLGRWVSELEPVVIYRMARPFDIAGLGIKGDPTATIVVENPAWAPGPTWRRFPVVGHVGT